MSLIYDAVLPLATADGFWLQYVEDSPNTVLLRPAIKEANAAVFIHVSDLELAQNKTNDDAMAMLFKSRYKNAKNTLLKHKSEWCDAI